MALALQDTLSKLFAGIHILMKKSLRVGEAMWKGKPVIGGDIGGIPLQIVHAGYRLSGLFIRMRGIQDQAVPQHPDMARRVGEKGWEHVKTNFLITGQIRDYLSVWHYLNDRRTFIEL